VFVLNMVGEHAADWKSGVRHLCLISTAIVSALVGALAAKLHTRWLTTCAKVPCKYLQIRLAVINQMIATRVGARDYLVIGDSLTEIGRWPRMCGHDPMPAGISGARSDTWLPHAKTIADILKPDLVVLALGTNDVLTQGRLGPYEQLASSLSGYRLVAVPIHKLPSAPQDAVQEANRRIARAVAHTAETIDADGVHLTAEEYARWFDAIEKEVCAN
jgi:lysophospholipase L1-like esterase